MARAAVPDPDAPAIRRSWFRIAGWRPPTKNRLFKGRLRDRIRLVKDCRSRLVVAALATGLAPAAGPRRLTLTLGYKPGERMADVDAHWSAVLDGLKHAGLIVDDSPRYVVLAPVRYRRSAEPFTRLDLEELG